jgi:NTP-dependent ternary system trypsin peptidase co-occuring protein
MKHKFRYLSVFAVLLGLTLIPNLTHAQEPSTDEGAQMTAVVQAIRSALVEAQTNNVKGFPRLSKATISLNTLTSKGGGAVFNFLIFTIGTKRSTDETSVLTVEMIPPPTVDSAATASVDPNKVKLALAQALNTAKQSVIEINKQGEPKLQTSKVEIELKFAVEKSGNLGVDVKLLPIGVEGTGSLKRNQVHSLKLVFGT